MQVLEAQRVREPRLAVRDVRHAHGAELWAADAVSAATMAVIGEAK